MYKPTQPITELDPSTLPLLMEVKQAAPIGGWSEKFIRDELSKGHIKGCKIGGTWRVNRDAFLKQVGLV